jgi:hypothetical protein
MSRSSRASKSKLQRFQGLEDFENLSNQSDNDSGGEDLFKDGSDDLELYNRTQPKKHYNNYEQDTKFGSVAPTARLKNPIMFQRVRNVLQNIKRRRLTFGELASLKNFIDALPASKLAHYNDDEIEKKIVNDWLKGQSQLNNEDSIIDTHELLKKNIGLNSENDTVASSINKSSSVAAISSNSVDVSSILGNNDIYSVQRIINPTALYTKTQILLDSRWRSQDTDGTTLFRWSFSNTVAAKLGTFNTTSPIRDIIAIKVLPFKIPYSASAENPTKNITMYYNEFSNQCVIAQENRKYHHWLDYVKEDDWLSLDATKYNKGNYFFDKPITTLDTLTVSFGSPLQIIQFDIDRMNAVFTEDNPTILTFPSAHNLDNGNTIYFTDFSTTNPVADAVLISAINSNFGHEVIRINSTQVSIAISTVGINGVMNSPIAYFGDKRIFIPLEITYIKPKN